MTLELQGVTRTSGGQVVLHKTDLVLERGTMNVLLGPTLAGNDLWQRGRHVRGFDPNHLLPAAAELRGAVVHCHRPQLGAFAAAWCGFRRSQ